MTRPDDDRGAPPADFRSPRRRRSRASVVAAVAVVVVLIAVAIGAYRDRDGSGTLQRVPLAAAATGVRGAAPLVEAAPNAAFNVLLVGSDERSSEDSDSGEVGGRRSDTIAIVHVDPATTTASVVSVPRDLWLPIAGSGRSAKINSAYNSGVAALIRTITENLGVPINRYLEIDFRGFRSLVDHLGGVAMSFATPVRDTVTGFHADAGRVVLSGADALLYARARHYETLEHGQWSLDPTGDLGRIRRQQDFLRQLARGVQQRSKGKPGALDDVLSALGPYLTVDAGFPATELLTLVERYVDVDPDSVPMTVLPARLGVVGSESVLWPDQTADDAVLAPLRSP